MKLSRCERESEVVAALRSGLTDAALEEHLGSCARCAETRTVASMMLRHAASLGASTLELPPANRIWRKAQAERRQAALRRATLALVWMRVLGAVYVTLLFAWVVRWAWARRGADLQPTWSVLATVPVLLGVGVAVAIVAAGAGCLLFLSNQDDRAFVPA